ncbi:LysE family translocator [Yersinia kristensenii]|uniref:LysE family translocator n=1 Tax=Yersinia kristensenii TaxID=28152 RepID=UPI000B668C06|nr:LysE family translocator [Yersinia kristensenii]MBW5813682.1 LysE family translocator [Yersinia kristensenii]MBW5817091.1 LysE family translocator [Yersinia kristensenii]MBW5830870.1 LysE family translocator [Yersinia kristensenii]MBW5842663.1 LysE family translocator [Yersinia kristensenii]MDA5490776.1 LysE family translocator [Yersinia kristensenii]
MIATTTLLMFSGACVALAATPGPDMLLITSRSISQGRAAGFASLAGIQLGTYCHTLAAALGLSQLFILVPIAYDTVRILGACYLLYLAWKTFTSAHGVTTKAALSPAPVHKAFRQGLITNLLNPKMSLFVLALFPQFITPQSGSVIVQMLLLATILNAIGLIINGSLILVVSNMRNRFKTRAFSARWPNYLLSGVFTGLACKLLFDSRK